MISFGKYFTFVEALLKLETVTSTSLESAKFLPNLQDKPSKIPENRSDIWISTFSRQFFDFFKLIR